LPDDLLKQVDHAINIFEMKKDGFATGLFLFDNAPSHQKWVPNALSAQKMPKNSNKDWSYKKDGPHMQNGMFSPKNNAQDLYFPDDHPTMPRWFKGMEIIIHEWGLWHLST